MEIIEEKPIPLAEVKEELSKIKREGEEEGFRITKTKEYLDVFAKVKKDKIDELMKKIKELNIPRLKEEMVVKIVDLLPDTEEDLKLIIQAYPVTISSQNIKKLIETVKEFKSKLK